MQSNSDKWLTEKSLNDTVSQSFEVNELLYHTKSPFQDIKVINTKALGNVLLLDDMAMISDKDEFIYHEVMVHIPLLSQGQTKNVLVIGAGDGGVIRELVRYPSIESITLCEIDQEVTNTCKEFFPHVTTGLNDKRVSCVFEDALEFIQEAIKNNHTYDLIISDSTDPVGLAENLYKDHFYKQVNKLLNPDGIFMCQTESPFYDEYDIKNIYQNLKNNFKIVQPVCAPILIYPGVFWTFAYCSQTQMGNQINESKLLEYQQFSEELRWHNPIWHKSSFSLPNMVSEKLGITIIRD